MSDICDNESMSGNPSGKAGKRYKPGRDDLPKTHEEMSLAKQKAEERRLDCADMLMQGLTTADIFTAIVQKYGVGIRTAHRDLAKARKLVTEHVSEGRTIEDSISEALVRCEAQMKKAIEDSQHAAAQKYFQNWCELTGALQMGQQPTNALQVNLNQQVVSQTQTMTLDTFNASRQLYGQPQFTKEEFEEYQRGHARKQPNVIEGKVN